MTGILRPFIRAMRVEKEKDGWWVMKKYHGYWFHEIPIPFKTQKTALLGMKSLRDAEERDRKKGIW